MQLNFSTYCLLASGLLLATLALPVTAAVDEDLELLSDEEKELPLWVNKSRFYIGDKVKGITMSMDDFFSRDYVPTLNESYLRFRLGQVFEEGGISYINNGVKLKLDLPKTENKLQLVVESANDDFDSLNAQNQEIQTDHEIIPDKNGSTGSLKYYLDPLGKWDTDFDVGVKLPFPPNPFIRYNMKRRYDLPGLWAAQLKHSLYRFREEGIGERSQFIVSLPLSDTWIYSNVVNMQWLDEGDILEYSEAMALFNIYSEKTTMGYSIGEVYQDHPQNLLMSYYTNIRVRSRLHGDWVFGDISQNVVWSRDRRFSAYASITFGIEVYFYQIN